MISRTGISKSSVKIFKILSFPNALVGNQDEAIVGPPTKTFGGDSFRINSKKFGFTLIEILLVLLILGIMAGLAIPNLSRTYSTILLKRTASDLVSLMRYAQSRALIQRQVFQLTLDPQTKRYRLQKADSNSPEKKIPLHFSPIPGRLGRAFEIPGKIRILTENPAIDFQPDGKITKASWSLCDKDHCLRISTKEQSGYVRVFEENY